MKYRRAVALMCVFSLIMCCAGTSGVFAETIENILVEEDFEGASPKFVGNQGTLVSENETSSDGCEGSDEGNHYLKLYKSTSADHSGNDYGASATVRIDSMPLNFALTVDIYKEEDNTQPFMFEYYTNDEDGNGEADAYGNLAISPSDMEVGKWYTLEARKVGGVKNSATYNAILTDSETGESKQVVPYYWRNVSSRSDYNRFLFRIENTAGCTTHWRIDNVKVEENFDFELPSRIVEVDDVYPTRKVENNGIVWTFADHVCGMVDDKTTSDKSDDEFTDVTVTPTVYVQDDGNILLTTKDNASLKLSTPYGAYIYSADNNQEGNPFSPSNFTDSNDFETTIRFDDYFYIMYYTGTHRFFLLFNDDSTIRYNDKNDVGRMIEADMGYGNWIDLKLSVRDKKWGTIFINGREIITYELPETTSRTPYIQYAVYKDDCITNLEIGDVKITPIDTESLFITSVSHRDEFETGENILLTNNKRGNVKYFVNGVLVGEDLGDGVTLSDMKTGVYDVVAEAEGLKSEPIRIFVKNPEVSEETEDYVNGEREYILEYEYDGSANGNVLVNDGYFTLDFTHSGNEINYRELNNDNASYVGIGNGIGGGKYKAVVTSGYAEVYFNNQFVFSTFLPYTYGENSVPAFEYDGISNVTKNPSNVKKERYHFDWDGRNELADYGMSFDRFYSAEFDKLDVSDETIIIYDGEYQAKLTFDESGIFAEGQKNDYGVTEKYILADNVQPGYYRLTTAKGLAQLFRNNEFIGSFKCPAVNHKDAVFRKIENPHETTFIAIKDTDDIYFHSEDFEGSGELDPLDYWSSETEGFVLAEGQKDPFTQEIVSENNNSFLKIKDTGLGSFVTPVTSLDAEPVGDFNLNVSADNPTFRWRAKADGNGAVHFLGRHIQKGIFLSFGYDFEQSKWILAQYDRMSDSGTNYDGRTVLTENNGSLDGGWHNYELVMNEGDVELICDGASVLNYSGLENTHGRLGFGVSKGATLFVDDVEYSGEGKVSAGVSYISAYGMGSKDFYYSPPYGGVMASSSNVKSYLTKDKGKTWEYVQSGAGNSVLNLLSGGYMSVGFASSGWNNHRTYSAYYPQKAYEYWNNGDRMINGKWGRDNLLVEPEWFDEADFGRSIMPSRLVQVQDGKYKGRIFYSRDAGKTESYGRPLLFYTDADNLYDPDDTSYYDGMTAKTSDTDYYPVEWTQSETSFFYDETGINGQEPMAVDMPDDVIRFFVRNDCGFLYYADSFDGGATFDNLKPSQLIAPLCCYSIKRDPNNLNHYYAFFEYEAATSEKSKDGGRPRTRGALAMSYDGMKNWHYVMDVEELTDDWKTSYTPMNHGMKIIDGTVYMSYAASGAGYDKIFAVDISKIKPLLRFSQVHDKVEYYTNGVSVLEEEYCVLPKICGKARIYGVDEEISVVDGNYSSNVIEKVFGMSEKESGFFEFCGTAVTIPADEKGNYDIADLARVFSKNIIETENAYVIGNSKVSRVAAYQLENMGVEKTFEEEIRGDFLNSLNVAAEFGNKSQFRRHIWDNREFLNINWENAHDSLLEKLMKDEYYEVSDFEKAFQDAVKAQKESRGQLILSSNKGIEEWQVFASDNAVRIKTENGEVLLETSSYYGSGGRFGTSAFNAPDSGAYVLTFDMMPKESSECAVEFGGKGHSAILNVTPGETAIDGNCLTLPADVWTKIRVVVTRTETESKMEITLISSDGTEKSAEGSFSAEVGRNGLWFGFPEEEAGELSVKNVRLYTGKVLDAVSAKMSEGKVTAEVELLNDAEIFEGGQLFVSVYDKNGLLKVKAISEDNISEKVQPFGIRRFTVENLEIGETSGDVQLKFYFWDGPDTLVPVADFAFYDI